MRFLIIACAIRSEMIISLGTEAEGDFDVVAIEGQCSNFTKQFTTIFASQ